MIREAIVAGIVTETVWRRGDARKISRAAKSRKTCIYR